LLTQLNTYMGEILFLTMVITIREYEEKDKEKLVSFMDQLQDYLIAIDPLGRLRSSEKYGERYLPWLLAKVREEQGLILFAEENNFPVAVIVGVIEEQQKGYLLECIPIKGGRVQELYVNESYRSNGVGSLLMKELEDYFIKNGCTVVQLEVSIGNKANSFYRRWGFEERAIAMIKVLRTLN